VIYTAWDPHVVIMEAKLRVNPRRMSAIEQRATPAAINGLRRPKRDLELSAITPGRRSATSWKVEKRRLVEQTDEGLDD
jgi:hypothetical protein